MYTYMYKHKEAHVYKHMGICTYNLTIKQNSTGRLDCLMSQSVSGSTLKVFTRSEYLHTHIRDQRESPSPGSHFPPGLQEAKICFSLSLSLCGVVNLF